MSNKDDILLYGQMTLIFIISVVGMYFFRNNEPILFLFSLPFIMTFGCLFFFPVMFALECVRYLIGVVEGK